MKNNRFKLLIIICVLLSFAACDEINKEDESSNLIEVSEAEISKIEMDSISYSLMINGYLNIKEGLVKSDLKAASFAAENLRFEMKGDVNQSIGKVLKVVGNIELSNSVEGQRIHFQQLSKIMYGVLKNSNFKTETLYYQYCPMAFDDTGAHWISNEEEIYNPYFGDDMLRCGKVVKKIN